MFQYTTTQQMQFSLFYFAVDTQLTGQEKYQLYLEGAKFADTHGFSAVWTPERHFHEVAGLYPNPATLSAALAMITRQIHLRAGSVVLPLHHPIRVVEEWSVVDNLSEGRVGISFTSGWVPNDFAFFPERYANKREIMLQQVKQVQQLWRGEALPVLDGTGHSSMVRAFPRPLQPELPIWLTCTSDAQMFVKAGELGANILTALMDQTLEDAAENIALYRQARAAHGYDPIQGHVTMMLHTFVGESMEYVLTWAKDPFLNYMKSHISLLQTRSRSLQAPDEVEYLDDLAHYAFARYTQDSSLIGTPETCLALIERLQSIGVQEVACLIDFGVPAPEVLHSLQALNMLRQVHQDGIHYT